MAELETKIPVPETEPLENDLRRQVDVEVFKNCGLTGNENILSWIEKYDDRLKEILNIDEEIKTLARQGKIAEAAALAKKKLDEWFGHDVSFYEV